MTCSASKTRPQASSKRQRLATVLLRSMARVVRWVLGRLQARLIWCCAWTELDTSF